MDLTVVVLNYNTKELLLSCLRSIFDKSWKRDIKVMVVDNASSDGSCEAVRKTFPKIEVVQSDKNLGFAGGNNLGLKRVRSKYCLLLNSDTEVLDGSLDNLIDFMERMGFGIGSCKLLNKNKSLQPNAGDLPLGLPLFFWIAGWDDVLPFIKKLLPSFHRQFSDYYSEERKVGWVSGAAMVIRIDVTKKIGLLDETIFMYGEDVEYCLRAKQAGFQTGWTDRAKIIHLGGRSWKEPSLNQWIGEFRGLLYIYRKYFGAWASLSLKVVIYTFTITRALAFLVTGKPNVSRTYAKLLFNI